MGAARPTTGAESAAEDVVQFGGNVGGDGLGPGAREGIADQAFLAAGMADEDEVVAEALKPRGFTNGERAVQLVVEEPAAARVVEVGGDRPREPFAVEPRVGLRVIAAAVGRLDGRTAPFPHLAQSLDQILTVIPRLMVGHHVLAGAEHARVSRSRAMSVFYQIADRLADRYQ